MNTEQIYFNAFNQVPEIGSVRLRKLLNFFSSLETAWQAPRLELLRSRLEEKVVNEILEARKRIDPEEEFAKLQKFKIGLLTYQDAAYPKLLKEIPNPPMLLYIKGQLLDADEMAIAVVGTRKLSSYGRQVTQDLVSDLVKAKLTIVSGLALGIDATAHQTALQAGGRTIAVLACGLNMIYPAANRSIAQKILEEKGAILSELPLNTPPLKHHFPYRNRIISGLSLGTIVVEAATDSGALITANHALEQNRQVFAVPGSIYNPVSAGPNKLIKMGARSVTSVSDILEELNLANLTQELATSEILGDNEEEQTVLAVISREPKHFDELVRSLDLPSSKFAATLTLLEMKGKVKNIGGNQYVLGR